MNLLIESFAWCFAQVTLLTLVAACVYVLARRLNAGGYAALLVAALVAVGFTTLLTLSPWPRWNLPHIALLHVDALEGGRSPSSGDVATPSSFSETLRSAAPDTGPLAPISSTSQPFIVKLALPTTVSESPQEPNVNIAADTGQGDRSWYFLVLAAWAASAVGAVRILLGMVHLRRYRRGARLLSDVALVNALQELHERFAMKRPVELRESPRLSVPATFGWRRPVVLLPATWREWSSAERRAVLAHELAHVRERHFPAWLLGQFVVAAHFYHPLVHWLTRRLRLEQEVAADNLAAGVFDDRRQYAAVLARLALGSSHTSHSIAPLGLFMSRPLLMRRIAMLRQSNEPARVSSRWKRGLLLLAVGLAAVGAAGLRASGDADAQLPPPTDPAQTMRVVSMLRASRDAGSLMNGQSQPMSDAAWKVFCSSQVALLKSDWMLTTSLRDPTIAELPVLKAQRQPIAWLQRNLRVGFVADSELMYVLMYCSASETDQVKQLVDAVVKTYLEEVTYKDQARKLVPIMALTQSLKDLNADLSRKMEDYLTTAKELGSAEGAAPVSQQLLLNRLDRIETELMRLESEQLELQTRNATPQTGDKVPSEKFYAVRIEQLKEQQDKLLDRIHASSEKSVELSTARSEIDQLQRIADDMRNRLETLQIDKSAPSRIELLHNALASDAGEPPDLAAER